MVVESRILPRKTEYANNCTKKMIPKKLMSLSSLTYTDIVYISKEYRRVSQLNVFNLFPKILIIECFQTLCA